LIGDNIRYYRKINNMSQEELAEKLDVTRQSVSLWESGQTQPSLDNIIALSKIFGVSTDDLLTSKSTEEPVGKSEEQYAAADAFDKGENENGGGTKKKKLLIICLICAVAAAAAVALIILLSAPGKSAGSGNKQTQSSAGGKSGGSVVSSSEQKKDPKDLYAYLKNFVIQNGTTKGDMSYYSKSADNYGGYASNDFDLWYWGDTDTVEFCLHTVVNETYSINFYIRVPKVYSGQYEYISSYYYRDTGSPVYEAKGSIDAAVFTTNYPLTCSSYKGSSEDQDWFMELSRQGVCGALTLLKEFTKTEHLDYSFADFGFKKF